MAAIIRAQIVNLQLRYNLTGNRLSCNLNYGCNSPLDIDDCLTLADSFETGVLPYWQALVSSDCVFDSIYCTADSPGVCKPRLSQLYNKLGTDNPEAIPENLGMVFRLTQYETNSKHNGRIYIAGLCESSIVDSLVSTAIMGSTVLDLKVALMATLAGAAGNNFNICSVSRRDAGAPITAQGWYTAAVVPTRALCTQRRRTTELTSYTA